MDKKKQELIEYAVAYAQLGWQVFPCHPTGHQPLVKRGFYAASCDEQQICTWWDRFPDAAIGLRTGEASGIFVVDIDPRHGGDLSLEDMEEIHGTLPETVESQTGGGGRHLLYRWPGKPVPCSTSKIAPGIDIKGDGGYIILPPSDHKSGREYCWLIGQEPGESELADVPEWLLEKLFDEAPPATSPKHQGLSADDVIPDGYRNATLASLAGHMRQVGMDANSITAALLATNRQRCQPPLDTQEVESIAESVSRYEPDQSRQAQIEHWEDRYLLPQEGSRLGDPVYRRMDEIEIEDIDWMWRGFLAAGKLAMISGNPGTGKSTISVDLAARVTTGCAWPDESEGGEPGSVILLSKEDAPGDTIKPRLQLAGADMSRVYILEGVRKPAPDGIEPVDAEFNLDTDLPALETLLKKTSDCRLVVVDPIGNYMGDAKGNDDVSIRKVLAPLAQLAMKYDVAVLVIAHLNKNSEKAAIHRTLGSVGFVGICRMVFGAVIDPADPTKQRRYLLPIKSNLASDRLGLAYTTATEKVGKTDHVKIVWNPEPVDINIDELTTNSSGTEKKGDDEDDEVDLLGFGVDSPKAERLREAMKWLVWRLSQGHLQQKELRNFALADGIRKPTLDRAKKKIGVIARRKGFGKDGCWFWELPKNLDPAEYLGEDWAEEAEDLDEDSPKAPNEEVDSGVYPQDKVLAEAL